LLKTETIAEETESSVQSSPEIRKRRPKLTTDRQEFAINAKKVVKSAAVKKENKI